VIRGVVQGFQMNRLLLGHVQWLFASQTSSEDLFVQWPKGARQIGVEQGEQPKRQGRASFELPRI